MMKNTISNKIKTTATFVFVFIIALTFTACSITFIVKNYGTEEVEKTESQSNLEIADHYIFTQKITHIS